MRCFTREVEVGKCMFVQDSAAWVRRQSLRVADGEGWFGLGV